MNFFKKIFRPPSNNPIEPIFPTENYSILKLDLPDGLAFATINTNYKDYPNRSFFPWIVLIEIEIKEKNANGHPLDSDSQKLNNLEESISAFLKSKHVTHFLARITRNGFRDLIYYVDKPNFTQQEVTDFCENVMKERGINLTMDKDPNWEGVSM